MLSDRLLHRLLHLTQRERLLLGALALVCLPLGVTFGLVLPLNEALTRAEREVVAARELLDWVQAEALRLPPEAQTVEPAGDGTPIGLSGLERSLVEAGLRDRIVELANRGAGEIEVGFTPLPFTALAAWLETVEREGGYDIAALRIEAAERSGEVTAQLTLAPRS